MKAVPRRDALKALGALSALASIDRPLSANALQTAQKFAPPTGPMRFSRRLVRNLTDGKQIIVERTWKVLFAPAGQGFMLDGEQISVEVSAPPGLEALADLERRKREIGLFPLMLTSDGVIMGNSGSVAQKSVIDRAIELASQEVAARASSEADRKASREFLRALQSSAEKATSRLPRDLFQPQQMSAVDERTLPLPDGTKGTVLIEFSAEISAQTGLMQKASRMVTTRIGDSERTSAEKWSLGPI
ncbi:hypothetical protein [Pontixanthobacter sp. CEM42]|uniref:hypothetical protein n=1 Tax=Pontixanthobacter sp. CEM42 TaxID=2792077 RepID=UPI001ADEF72C|nr:hypothetical protein [Pontixanthobacter sp. CEM42]